MSAIMNTWYAHYQELLLGRSLLLLMLLGVVWPGLWLITRAGLVKAKVFFESARHRIGGWCSFGVWQGPAAK
jgi:hypothetical protein